MTRLQLQRNLNVQMNDVARIRPAMRTKKRVRVCISASSSDRRDSTSTQRNLPVPFSPPQRGPPPPPPPPSFQFIPTATSRRDAILGTLLAAGVTAGVISGFSASGPSVKDEQQLAYVASQIGVPSAPSPVSAIVDKQKKAVVAVAVMASDGTNFIATVDAGQPSRMILEAQNGVGNSKGSRYVLQTRYDSINLANRRQVESIFRMAGWENALQQIGRNQ